MEDTAGAVVRDVRPEDVPAVHALVRELAAVEGAVDQVVSTPALLAEALFGPDPAVFCLVVEVDGAVVGFAQWFLTFSTWTGRYGIWLDDLYVRTEHRGGGHGTALIAELARVAVARGYARLEWWVLDDNTPAVGFYRALGATSMDDWTAHRLDGGALDAVARRARSGLARGRTTDAVPPEAWDRSGRVGGS